MNDLEVWYLFLVLLVGPGRVEIVARPMPSASVCYETAVIALANDPQVLVSCERRRKDVDA